MKDQNKTKKQLLEELEVLHHQLVRVKKTETNRKRVGEALKESEQRFRTIFEGAVDGILLADIETKKFRVGNKMICKMLGYSLKEVKNLSVTNIHPKEALPFVMEQFDKLARGEITKTNELPVRRKDGSVFYAEISTVLLKVDAGTYLMGTFRDITDRKQAEEALRKSAEQYRTITNTSMDGFAIVDVAGRLLDVNEVYSRMIGYSRDELLKMSVSDIEAMATPEEIQTQHKKTMVDSQLLESRHRRKDGRIIDVEVSMTFMRQSGQIFVFLRDITERKEAEEALQKSEERFRLLAESSLTGIYLFQEGRFLYVNKALASIFGYKVEEMVGHFGPLDLTHPDDQAAVTENVRRRLSGEVETIRSDFRGLRKDGEVIFVEVHGTRIEYGGKVGIIGTLVDITERKRAENALKESEDRYRHLVEGSPAIVWSFSDKNGTLFASSRVKSILGYSPDFLYKNPWLWNKSIHPDDQYPVAQSTKDFASGKDLNVEYRIKDSSGNWRWFHDRSIGKHIENEATIIEGISIDITERKRAEQALRESEERMKSIFRAAPIGIGVVTNRVLTDVNTRICEMTGYSREELVGSSARVLYPTQYDLDYVGTEKYRQIAEKGTGSVETRWMKKDSTIIDVLLSSTPINPSDLSRGVTFTVLDITESKHAERALRESEERFRLAFENANTGVCLVDPDGNLTRVNNKMCEIFGYTKQELEAMTVNDIAHPEDLDKSPEFIQETLQGKIDRGTFEKRYFHKKGHVVTCQVSSSLVRDAAGTPLYFISHLHDITDRKQAEEALRQSEERYRTILEDIEEGYFEVDLTGRSTFINDSLCKIYGYPREEFLGIDNRRFTDKENAKRVFEAFNQVYRTGEPGRLFDYEIIRKDGTKRQVEVFPSLRKDSSGNPIGFRGITRDVTERKKAEEALQKEREISLSILENAPYGVALIDKGGEYIYINPEFTNITGYALQDIPTGKDWFQKAFSDPKDRERMMQVWKKDRSKGNMINREFSINRKDGKTNEIETRSTFLRDGRAVMVLHDTTEQKRAEEEMKSLQEQLRQSQKMEAIGRLAGGIAHDFNNLLTIIKGYSQLSLIELKEDTPLKGNIEHIHTATDRAADLVRQLLAFSRRQILEMKAWDLNTILTNLQNMLRRLIGEDIKLTTILAEDLGRVKTDLGWIEQAIMNLVVNARDAMPSGGKLTIGTGNAVLDEAYVSGRVGVKPGRYVMFSVSDTGVGMTPEVRERLFEPFFSTKEKDKGTGLGLSTVYGIVKQSDGDIWVYSEPGKGSTFKIYLPRVDEPPEQLREKVSGDELLRGSETILLVEDEEEVRKLAVRVLERQGYKVLAARDGDEALLICEGHQDPIHLMLTDVVMPGMNGHELAERLESLRPRMKVLYMSGYTDNAIVLHGVLVEGVNYIQKPFTVDALTKKVREVLGQ